MKGKGRKGERAGASVVIALGANLSSAAGPPRETLIAAAAALSREGIMPMRLGPLVHSAAVGGPQGQPAYVNTVISARSALPAPALMKALLRIEQRFGRERGERWAPRRLDLDLISYGALALRREEDPPLKVPHPEAAHRAFVLMPLKSIAPHWRHPVLGRTAANLEGGLPGPLRRETRPLKALRSRPSASGLGLRLRPRRST